MPNPNHPKIGSSIRVSPIRSTEDVANIKKLLKDKPRDLAIFTLGINTCLRASDILKIKVGQVKHLKQGDSFCIKEKKTGKDKCITLNPAVSTAFRNLLAYRPFAKDTEYLFQSKMGADQPLTVPALNALVKKWCDWIGLKENYGSHTLRKTFGYMHYHIFKTPVVIIMDMLNHSNLKMTYIYLGIQPEDVKEAYMKEI